MTAETIATVLLLTVGAPLEGYEGAFSDFRVGASVSAGGNANRIEAPINAGLNLSFHTPLFDNFGVRASLSLLTLGGFNTLESGTGVFLSAGAGADYTLSLGSQGLHGMGFAAGVEYVFLSHLELGNSQRDPKGALAYGELSYRRAMRIGLWAFGVRAESLLNDPEEVFAASAFFRFNFRF